jgi:hypothetical protein
MLQHVLSSNIGHDRERGPRMNDVREILVRSDTEIDATGTNTAVQVINDVQVGCLVGYDIIGVEVPFGFRPIINVSSQLLDRNGNISGRLWLLAGPWYDARANYQYEHHSETDRGTFIGPGNA